MIEHVDPFIGVDGAGNCLPGPYLPLSLVRLGPDTLYPQDTNGYRSKRPIVGFSHTHVSGTGGGGRYGNILVRPFVGPPRLHIDPYERQDERASCGFYGVTLTPAGISAELTVTPRVGVHRYTFSGGDAGILIDVGAAVQRGGKTPGDDQAMSIGGYVEWVSETEVVGRGDYQGGWGHRFPYSVYFYARFDTPAVSRQAANAEGFTPWTFARGSGCKAVAGFGAAKQINLQVGISYVSVANARASVERETAGRSFDDIRSAAEQTWRDSLNRIRVTGGTAEQKTLFYTLFTRLICMPSDLGIDDENPMWRSGVRHFVDYYCLWDSVRNANSLITLFDPKLEADMLNCLLDIADHIGWLPDAWIAFHSAMIQGGSSADVLLCEAFLKGLKGIDYEKALRQMRKNNEVESPDPWLYGRHLRDYRDLGYLSTNVRKNSVSRHLEYAYQDWCIGRLAEGLGQGDAAADYYQSSRKAWNLWRDDAKVSGFFAPKQPDGAWVDSFDPGKCLSDSWNDPYFYEGKGWQWMWSVQHDFAGLVRRLGGAEGFVRRLDDFFGRGFYGSKETMLHVPYLYIYGGRPDKTVERVRSAMGQYFRVARNGLHDNEDMGCQSAFYMCSAMGLYPMMGQDLYLLTSPVFERVEIELGSPDRLLVIEAPGAGAFGAKHRQAALGCGTSDQKHAQDDAEAARYPVQYVKSATLNGKPLNRAWLRHSEIAGGAVLRFELSDTPGDWGRDNPPPSPLAELGDRA